ncbi:hypothetical protein Tco_1159631 [Tanacetum coccineum]
MKTSKIVKNVFCIRCCHKSELKRGYSRLLANASGLCKRIRANDVEIQCRESSSFDLEVCGEKFLLCRPYLGFKRVGLTRFGHVRYHVSGRFSAVKESLGLPTSSLHKPIYSRMLLWFKNVENIDLDAMINNDKRHLNSLQ